MCDTDNLFAVCNLWFYIDIYKLKTYISNCINLILPKGPSNIAAESNAYVIENRDVQETNATGPIDLHEVSNCSYFLLFVMILNLI